MATTFPVIPSPSAYLPRSISSWVSPTAASVRNRPVDSSNNTRAPRCICNLSEIICITFENASRSCSVEERIWPISVKMANS